MSGFTFKLREVSTEEWEERQFALEEKRKAAAEEASKEDDDKEVAAVSRAPTSPDQGEQSTDANTVIDVPLALNGDVGEKEEESGGEEGMASGEGRASRPALPLPVPLPVDEARHILAKITSVGDGEQEAAAEFPFVPKSSAAFRAPPGAGNATKVVERFPLSISKLSREEQYALEEASRVKEEERLLAASRK